MDTPYQWPVLAGAPWRARARCEIVGTVVRFYGSSLRPWPRESLLGFEIPDDVRDFLAESGLPLDPGLPLVRFLGPPLHWRREGLQRLLVVGSDEGTELRMREGSAEIVSARPFGAGAARFVNSTALELLDCLRQYAERREDLHHADDEGALNIASDLRAGIAAVDPLALEHPDTWWSRVLDRVEAGFE